MGLVRHVKKVETNMKFSTLVNALVHAPSTWQGVYCQHYAPGLSWSQIPETAPTAPAKAHAANQFRTFAEISADLDRSGIEVHQEGALARFEHAASAPLFGRAQGAVTARAKTLAFCHALLAAAVQLRGATTFAIPASEAQGYYVVSHEALVSLDRFRAATAALAASPEFVVPADRPELITEKAKHDATREGLRTAASKAGGMHQTAVAEVLACGLAADRGPWFREAKPDGSDVPRGVFVVGVEVPGSSPAILARCQANLDPQHAGGVYGLGAQILAGERVLAACDAALALVRAGLPVYPDSTRFVTSRFDPDAFLAAIFLRDRAVAEMVLANPAAVERVRQLATYDSSESVEGHWAPVYEPASVGDCPIWGPFARLCIPDRRSGLSLATLEAAALATLFGLAGPQCLTEARVEYERAWAEGRSLAAEFIVRGPVALGRGPAFARPPQAGTWAAGYSRAPIVVLSGVIAGKPKFTIACSRHLPAAKAAEFHRTCRAKLNAAEDTACPIGGERLGKWSGPATLTGNPQGQGSRLGASDVTLIVEAAALEAGLSVGFGGATAHPQTSAQRPWLS